MASSKDLNPLKKAAKQQGWDVTPTRGGKLKWVNPAGGLPYFSSATPGDRRAVHNIAGDLRKRGLALT